MTTNNSKALKSGIWYTIAKFIFRGIAFFTTPIFTRLLTKEEFGAYNNYLSWLQILTIFLTMNMVATLISAKYDYKKNFDQYILSVFALSSFVSCLSIVVFNLFGSFFSSFFKLTMIQINCLSIYILFENAITLFLAKERYYYKYKTTVLLSLVNAIVTSLLSVLLVIGMKDRLFGRILGNVIPAVILGSILVVYFCIKGKRIDFSVFRYAIPISLPFIPHLLSLVLLNSMDRIMITKICGEGETALYSLAHTCGAIVTLLIASMNEAYGPWLGEQLHYKQYGAIRRFSNLYVSVFIYCAVGIMLISPEILLFLGGKEYQTAKYVMPPVTMGYICQFVYVMLVCIEQFNKKTVGMAIGSVSAAVLNYVLNAIFIPKYGYIAAAYTTLVGFFWLMLVHMFLVYRLGFKDIYNYKLLFATIGTALLITIGVNYSYQHTYPRLIFTLIYAIPAVAVPIKYKKELKQIIAALKH